MASLINCGVRVEPVSRRLDETMSKLHQKECHVLMPARDRQCQALNPAFANGDSVHPLLAEAGETKPLRRKEGPGA